MATSLNMRPGRHLGIGRVVMAIVAAASLGAAGAAPGAIPYAERSGLVLVFPFMPIDAWIGEGSGTAAWRGKSVQQTVLADLAAAGRRGLSVIGDDAPMQNIAAAVAGGRKVGARYVILGTFVSDPPDLRLTGYIVDVETGLSVGGLKATGSARDAFRLEDAVAGQAMRYFGIEPPATHVAGHGDRATDAGAGARPRSGGTIVLQPTGHLTHPRGGALPTPATSPTSADAPAPDGRGEDGLEYGEQSVRLPLAYDPRENVRAAYGPVIFYATPDYSPGPYYPSFAYGYRGLFTGRRRHGYGRRSAQTRGPGGHVPAAGSVMAPGPVFGSGYVLGYGFPESSWSTSAFRSPPGPTPGVPSAAAASHAGHSRRHGRR